MIAFHLGGIKKDGLRGIEKRIKEGRQGSDIHTAFWKPNNVKSYEKGIFGGSLSSCRR